MTPLTKTQQAVLACLQKTVGQGRTDFDFTSLDDDAWYGLLEESRLQTVDLLCYDATNGTALPPDVASRWLMRSARLFSANIRIRTVQQRLADLLGEADIPYVILKGLASAHFYPNPENRIGGDIDFLVPEGRIEETAALLTQNGALRDKAPNENHLSFDWQGVKLELHHSIAGIPKNKYGKILSRYFEQIFDRAVTDPGLGFKKPADCMHGVIILLHTLHHITSKGVGLRQICDWACFVSATHTRPFWKEELIPLLESVGLMKFAAIMTEVSVSYLGISRPEWVNCECDAAARELILDVFRHGNFGKKAAAKAGTQIMVAKDSKKSTLPRRLKTMLDTLRSTNHAFCPTLDKLPWLSPFVTVWRILRYLALVICGKRESLFKASHYAEERSRLLEDFELYKVE